VDRLSLRARFGWAPITRLIALRMLGRAGTNDRVHPTGWDRSAVTRAAGALRSAGLVHRMGARGDFALAGGEFDAETLTASLAGTIPDAGHEPENNRIEPEKNRIAPENRQQSEKTGIEPENIGVEPEKNRIAARSSSSSLISYPYQVDDKRTTTTTPGDAEKNRIEPAKSSIEPEESPFGDDDRGISRIDAAKSRIMGDEAAGAGPTGTEAGRSPLTTARPRRIMNSSVFCSPSEMR